MGQLIFAEEEPIFDFDTSDHVIRKEFQKQIVGGTITVSALWGLDIAVLNRTQWGISLGPLRKFAIINGMCLPVYWYLYTQIKQSHQDLKKHLVTKYLIADGEILYKRKISL